MNAFVTFFVKDPSKTHEKTKFNLNLNRFLWYDSPICMSKACTFILYSSFIAPRCYLITLSSNPTYDQNGSIYNSIRNSKNESVPIWSVSHSFMKKNAHSLSRTHFFVPVISGHIIWPEHSCVRQRYTSSNKNLTRIFLAHNDDQRRSIQK